jgi:hypothetical protein
MVHGSFIDGRAKAYKVPKIVATLEGVLIGQMVY